MLYLLIVIVIGIAVGYIRGGSISNLSNANLNFGWLLYLGIALIVAAQFIPASASFWAFVLVVASFGLVFGVSALNYRVPGMVGVGIGALCNFVVIVANRGMPVSKAAAIAAGKLTPQAQEGLLLRGKHFLDTGEARLRFLGDNYAIFGRQPILSIGDFIIWAGIIVILQHLMQPKPESGHA